MIRIDPFLSYLVEACCGTRNQSGSFSLVNVRSGVRCPHFSFYNYQGGKTSAMLGT
jgi:hypothetical protein